LKLNIDRLHQCFAVVFNLRHYTMARKGGGRTASGLPDIWDTAEVEARHHPLNVCSA
jgi:hypothetical protein